MARYVAVVVVPSLRKGCVALVQFHVALSAVQAGGFRLEWGGEAGALPLFETYILHALKQDQ